VLATQVGGDTQFVNSKFTLFQTSLKQVAQLEKIQNKKKSESTDDEDIDQKLSQELANKLARQQVEEDEALALALAQNFTDSEDDSQDSQSADDKHPRQRTARQQEPLPVTRFPAQPKSHVQVQGQRPHIQNRRQQKKRSDDDDCTLL